MVEISMGGGDAEIGGSRILVPVQIGSISGGVTAVVSGSLAFAATVVALGTVLSPVPVVIQAGGTINIGTITLEANLADVGTIGTILSPVTIVNPSYLGTVGTILFVPNMADVGTVGTILSPILANLQPSAATFATLSATIAGTGGTLYGVMGSSPIVAGTISATLLLLHSGGQQVELVFPPNQTTAVIIDRGMKYSGSLVASILGTMHVTVLS